PAGPQGARGPGQRALRSRGTSEAHAASLRYRQGMSTRTIGLSEALHRYVVEVGTREDDLLRRLRAETAEKVPDVAEMQISAEQGQFMQWLTTALGARRAIEIGTFTGYSSICIARALPADGKLVCI